MNSVESIDTCANIATYFNGILPQPLIEILLAQKPPPPFQYFLFTFSCYLWLYVHNENRFTWGSYVNLNWGQNRWTNEWIIKIKKNRSNKTGAVNILLLFRSNESTPARGHTLWQVATMQAQLKEEKKSNKRNANVKRNLPIKMLFTAYLVVLSLFFACFMPNMCDAILYVGQ